MARTLVGSRGPVLAAGLLLLLAAGAQAGPIFIPGHMDGDKFVAAKDAGTAWYSVRYSTTGVNVENQAARVQVEEVIEGPDKAVQAVCLIPLPEGAEDGDIRVTLGAPGAKPTILGDAKYLDAKKRRRCTRRWPRGPARRKGAGVQRPAGHPRAAGGIAGQIADDRVVPHTGPTARRASTG